MTSNPWLAIEHHEGIAVARLKGSASRHFTSDHEVEQFKIEFNQVLEQRDLCLLVADFSEVKYFEANFRGMLVGLSRKLQQRGGQLAVCHLPPGMREHFTLVMLDQIMLVVETVEEAIAKLRDYRSSNFE